jgi:hypothetical protein
MVDLRALAKDRLTTALTALQAARNMHEALWQRMSSFAALRMTVPLSRLVARALPLLLHRTQKLRYDRARPAE